MAFFLFICHFSFSGCIGELCEDFKRYHLSSIAVILAFPFALFSWYLQRVFFLKCKPKTILIVHIHFPIKYRTNTNRSICLHLFSCSQRLLVERYTHSDRLITNHLWCHCSIVVKFFFLICVFDHDDWTFASFFFPFLWTLTSSRSIKKGRGRTKPISGHLDRSSFVNKGFII